MNFIHILTVICIALIVLVGCSDVDESEDMTSLRRERRDRHGCDLPTKFVKAVSSCGPKGKCCDVHDACYKRHSCTRSSWFKPFGACGRCNAAVVACITHTFPGKSTCCSKNICGKPR